MDGRRWGKLGLSYDVTDDCGFYWIETNTSFQPGTTA